MERRRLLCRAVILSCAEREKGKALKWVLQNSVRCLCTCPCPLPGAPRIVPNWTCHVFFCNPAFEMFSGMRGNAEAAKNSQNSWLVAVCLFCQVCTLPPAQALLTVFSLLLSSPHLSDQIVKTKTTIASKMKKNRTKQTKTQQNQINPTMKTNYTNKEKAHHFTVFVL